MTIEPVILFLLPLVVSISTFISPIIYGCELRLERCNRHAAARNLFPIRKERLEFFSCLLLSKAR